MRRYPGYLILVVEGERPWLPKRSVAAEARVVATCVPVKIAERWRVVRLAMTRGLARRVREDRN